MSHLLWQYFWDDDADRFGRLLDTSGSYPFGTPRSGGVGTPTPTFGSSPALPPRRDSGHGSPPAGPRSSGTANLLSFAEVNSRDHAGTTVLLRAASSSSQHAIAFVRALLNHPAIDIRVQDAESGWNALHRALYMGNVSIACLLLEKEGRELTGRGVGGLASTNDHDGLTPFELYNSSISGQLGASPKHWGCGSVTTSGKQGKGLFSRGFRVWPHDDVVGLFAGSKEASASLGGPAMDPFVPAIGDELYVFGSNKNLSLGTGDQDDRQYPERIPLARPESVVQRLYQEYSGKRADDGGPPPAGDVIPQLFRSRPLLVRDVAMAKYHTAVVTSDPFSNLYVTGLGRGGRLGLGDENTRFRFVPVQGPLAAKEVRTVAVGKNHTMAVVESGQLWTWGLNTHSQLGYRLPPPSRPDEEPMSTLPRQVFGLLKREFVEGIAASSHHSAAHTDAYLFCWGRNVGQLGLMDSDSRSLDMQVMPRKVGVSLISSRIMEVRAIEKATICLLGNGTVCVFANYGYCFVKFPCHDAWCRPSRKTLTPSKRNPATHDIRQIAAGGDTIVAVTVKGDVFSVALRDRHDHDRDRNSTASTANPTRIRGAVTQPQHVWRSAKDPAATAGVTEDGSVVVGTRTGAVWQGGKRAATGTANASGGGGGSKDSGFRKVPNLADVVTVRSSAFGAFAAVRRDPVVMSAGDFVWNSSFKFDIEALCPLIKFEAANVPAAAPQKIDAYRKMIPNGTMSLVFELLLSQNIEADVAGFLDRTESKHRHMDMRVWTTSAPKLKIPCHSWVLTARSPVILWARSKDYFTDCGIISFHRDEEDQDKFSLVLGGLSVYTLLNLIVYAYTDFVTTTWLDVYCTYFPPLVNRQVRSELSELASSLKMPHLEATICGIGARQFEGEHPPPRIRWDLKKAIEDPAFFSDADAIVELRDGEVPLHSALACRRCLFFEVLFNGRSGGLWMAGRRQGKEPVRINFKHAGKKAFHFVRMHLYGDPDVGMFDQTVAASADELCDLVMEVMGLANELMLDRLTGVCQQLMARFVHTRSIAGLLNEIGLCSVTAFKDAGLGYVCLQMVHMLENNLLDELDDDLLAELDRKVCEVQRARKPYGRSVKAELLLRYRYPELAADTAEERRRRARDVAFRLGLKEKNEIKLSTPFKSRTGGPRDVAGHFTPARPKRRTTGASGIDEPVVPDTRPGASSAGSLPLDVHKHEKMPGAVATAETPVFLPDSGHSGVGLGISPFPSQNDSERKRVRRTGPGAPAASPEPPTSPNPEPTVDTGTHPVPTAAALPSVPHGPWPALASCTPARPNLKSIMNEAAASAGPANTSSVSPAAERSSGATVGSPPTRPPQKERKRLRWLRAQQPSRGSGELAAASRVAWEPDAERKEAPWKPVASEGRVSLGSVISHELSRQQQKQQQKQQPHQQQQHQEGKDGIATQPKHPQPPPPRSHAGGSPDTRPLKRVNLDGSPHTHESSIIRTTQPASASASPFTSTPQFVPRSKSYMPPRHEPGPPAAGLSSMADIMDQQEREQEMLREAAAAKHSLQEIQQEQAFQEWWDQESRKAMGEEERVEREAGAAASTRGGGGRGRRGGQGNMRGAQRGHGRGGRDGD